MFEEVRRRQIRVLADDMPWVVRQFRNFATGQPFEMSLCEMLLLSVIPGQPRCGP